MVILGTELQ